MPSKKSTKVTEPTETITAPVVEEQTSPPVKTKSKKQVKENTAEPVEQESEKVTKPKKEKVKKVTETEVQVPDESEKVIKPKKETKSKKVTESTDDSELEKVIKPKKETKSKKAQEPQHIEITSQSEIILEPKDDDQFVNDPELQELEDTKKYWSNIADKIHNNNLEREKLETECTQIIKRLNELLDKYTNKQDNKEGFMIDTKVQSTNTKNKIIQTADSDSESTSESESDSDSDEKPTLTKKTKSKPLIKTTKGNSKGIKLVNNDSDSDSN